MSILAIYPLDDTQRIVIRKVGAYLEEGDICQRLTFDELEDLLYAYGWSYVPAPEFREGSTCSGVIG